MSILYLSLRVL